MKEALVMLDGRIVRESDAREFWADPGFRRGFGLFETIRIATGRPFLPGCHALRMTRASPRLGIRPWLHPRTLARLLVRLVERTGVDEGVLRLFMTPGQLPGGEGSAGAFVSAEQTPPPGRPRYLATVSEERLMRLEQARAIIAPDRRDPDSPLSGLKTLSYAAEKLLLESARSRGANEALRRNLDGRLTEGTWSNLFLIERDRLVTPPVSEGLLPGITRWLVLRTARENGLEPVEEPMTVERLVSAEEAFLTSTLRGVVPLVAVDDRSIGQGERGPRAVRLAGFVERLIKGVTKEEES